MGKNKLLYTSGSNHIYTVKAKTILYIVQADTESHEDEESMENESGDTSSEVSASTVMSGL